MKVKILEIGNIIKLFGIRLIVTKAVQGCRGCYFKTKPNCHTNIVGACARPWRSEDVIFRKYDATKIENLHSRSSKAYKTTSRKKSI